MTDESAVEAMVADAVQVLAVLIEAHELGIDLDLSDARAIAARRAYDARRKANTGAGEGLEGAGLSEFPRPINPSVRAS